MKLLENPKLNGAALILLLALNSALLVVLIARRPGPPPAPIHDRHMPPLPPPGDGPKEMLIEGIGLNDAQALKLDTMAAEHHRKMETMNRMMKAKRDSLIDAISSSTVDSAKVKEIAMRIGAKQAEIEQLNYWHFRDVRGLCTDEQKPRFDSVIHDALRMMGPHPGPPPQGMGPPPPPGPGGPPPPPPGPHHPPH